VADDTLVRTQMQLDKLVAEELRCPAGHPLHPVYQKGSSAYCSWTCPVPGCSRMLPPEGIEGRVGVVLSRHGLGHTKVKETIARYVQFLRGSSREGN
jgi:hypothetical protein